MGERRPRAEMRAYLCRDLKIRSGVLAWVRPVQPAQDQTWAQKMNPRAGMVLSSLATPVAMLDFMEELVEPGGVVEVTLIVRGRPNHERR